jgi:transposase, IS605 OrfB family, central region
MVEANRTLILPLELPSSDEDKCFHQTIEKYQYCRDRASGHCWQSPTQPDDIVTSKRAVEDALYHDLREETNGLHANLVQKAIKDVTSAMDSVKKAWQRGERISKPTWDTTESWVMTYDTRAGTFSKHDATFATTGSTVTLEYHTPANLDETPYNEYVLSSAWELTTSKLAYRHGQYWLHLGIKRDASDQHWTAQANTEVSNAPTEDTSRVLGVDLNVKRWTAVTSAGGFHGNADYLNHRRTQYEELRGELQQTGTRSAYLRLHERSGTESAWFDEYAHAVSNSIVEDALDTCSTHIAFEELDGIRERMSNLPKYQQWMFGRVQDYVEYKAAEHGISVVYVSPRNTSKQCSHTECQTVSSSNRREKRFECESCGRSWNADYNAARNIGLNYMFDSVLPASQTCSSGKATSQLALMSGVLSVTERDVNHVSKDWMSTDKPTALAVGS